MATPKITVSEFSQVIKSILESEVLLQQVQITGELSNLREYKLGKQLYFNLIDSQSQLNCVIYDTNRKKLKFTPENGQHVTVMGALKVYAKKGGYTFQVHTIIEEGKGDLKNKLDQLKAALIKEGLFDTERKQEIPNYPEHIAVITAPGSAALADFTSILTVLYPQATLTVLPATMQGEKCSASIQNAMTLAHSLQHCELILVMRGGGSSEDLAAFNDESLVRALAASKIPVITAIGHEIDYSLCDFAADLRVPTPTAAAEQIARPHQKRLEQITTRLSQVPRLLLRQVNDYKAQCLSSQYDSKKAIETTLSQTENSIKQTLQRLESANPLNKLKQGYSFLRNDASNTPIRRITDLEKHATITGTVRDGKFKAKVTEIIKDEHQ